VTKKLFQVYGLSHPITDELRYVGLTAGGLAKRLSYGHCSPSKRNQSPSAKWCRKLKSEGLSPKIELIENCPDFKSMQATEIFYIAYFRSLGFRLLNVTDGGDYPPPHTRTQDVKISRSRGGCTIWDQYGTSYEMAVDCAKLLGISPGHISSCLEGKRPHASGFIFSKTKPKDPILGPAHPVIRRGTSRYGLTSAISQGNEGIIVDNFGNRYVSKREAARKLKICRKGISKVLSGKAKAVCGYSFKYISET
jgi:hypothetical protein